MIKIDIALLLQSLCSRADRVLSGSLGGTVLGHYSKHLLFMHMESSLWLYCPWLGLALCLEEFGL